jgi:hypothetical protein
MKPTLLSPAHRWLLQAIFLSGPAAISAWEQWHTHADFEALDWGSYQLLPLLYQNLIQLGVEHPWMPRMKGVQRLFWCKNQASLAAFQAVAAALTQMEIAPILVTPVGIRNHPRFQPSGQFQPLNLQLTPAQAPAAIATLKPLGWTTEVVNPQASLNYAGVLYLRHATHPPLHLHSAFSRWWHAPALMHACQQRAVPWTLGTVQGRVWSPTDQALHQVLQIAGAGLTGDQTTGLPALAELILLFTQADFQPQQLWATASQHRLLVPLSQVLQALQTLQLPAPQNNDNGCARPISPLDRWEYSILQNRQSHLLARGVRRYAQFHRQMAGMGQTPSVGTFLEFWRDRKALSY